MTRPVELSAAEVKNLAVCHQFVLGGQYPGVEGVARWIGHLGYVQIDTISVVERAHHHTLWSRCPDYRPEHLDTLLSEQRRVFEFWGHAASYLPLCDYRFYLPRMRAFPRISSWEEERWSTYGHLAPAILERIRNEGPLQSKDFEAPQGLKPNGWWDWKPAKIVLELLLWKGDLMVTARRGFQRVYDLTERVLPDWVNTALPSPDEFARFLVQKALTAHGVCTLKDIDEHLSFRSPVLEVVLNNMIEERLVVPIRLGEETLYALTDTVTNIPASVPPVLRILSPFDNSVILRKRVKRVFGFDYTIECYVPEAKRVYGYFSLPVMYGSDLIGRMDCKAHRREKLLEVRNMCFESGVKPDSGMLKAFAETLMRYAKFNGCHRCSITGGTLTKVNQRLETLTNRLFE